jgi:hypothetical protein
MSILARAWEEFTRALDEARDLHERGAEPHTLAELLRYARELLDIIADEIVDEPSSTAADARVVLAQLCGRLESLERNVVPTRH